jgi:phospholipid/cholesterol/gamma-HCH transport system substrate-binding protein
MQRSKLDLWVGLFVVVGAAAVVFLALKAANLLTWSLSPGYTLVARFDNIGGLKRQAAVKSAGVVVGRVQSIDFDPKTYQARVSLSMEKAYQFPKDTSAKILTAGLLGEQYIGLEPGYEDKPLAEGDVITQTQSAMVLESLISQFLYNKASEAGGSKDSSNAKEGESKP